MSAYDDVEIAVRFLKSIHTKDPKTDLEIGLIVQRLEALIHPANQTHGARHGHDRRDPTERPHSLRYHHNDDDLADAAGARRRRR